MVFCCIAASQPRSSVTEQDIIDTLTAHAQRVADSVLSNKESGLNLENDAKVSLLSTQTAYKLIKKILKMVHLLDFARKADHR
jgi:hypothetical protein